MASEWVVHTPGGTLRLSDLTLEEAITLEEQTGLEWWNIASHPFRLAKVARAVYTVACANLGCDPKPLALGDLVDGKIFEQVEDDMPDVYENGIPKAEDAAQTDG